MVLAAMRFAASRRSMVRPTRSALRSRMRARKTSSECVSMATRPPGRATADRLGIADAGRMRRPPLLTPPGGRGQIADEAVGRLPIGAFAVVAPPDAGPAAAAAAVRGFEPRDHVRSLSPTQPDPAEEEAEARDTRLARCESSDAAVGGVIGAPCDGLVGGSHSPNPTLRPPAGAVNVDRAGEVAFAACVGLTTGVAQLRAELSGDSLPTTPAGAWCRIDVSRGSNGREDFGGEGKRPGLRTRGSSQRAISPASGDGETAWRSGSALPDAPVFAAVQNSVSSSSSTRDEPSATISFLKALSPEYELDGRARPVFGDDDAAGGADVRRGDGDRDNRTRAAGSCATRGDGCAARAVRGLCRLLVREAFDARTADDVALLGLRSTRRTETGSDSTSASVTLHPQNTLDVDSGPGSVD